MPLFFIPSWSGLRTIGGSLPAKASILMPFVGYIILFQADVVRIISEWSPAKGSVGDNTIQHIGINFYFLYFGLFIFGVGSLIFSLFCDGDVKRHPDADSYCSYARPTCSPKDLRAYCTYVIRITPKESAEKKNVTALLNTLESGITNISEENIIFIIKEHYTTKNTQFFGLRLMTAVCFIVGMALIALPSLMVFWKVLGMFVSQLSAA